MGRLLRLTGAVATLFATAQLVGGAALAAPPAKPAPGRPAAPAAAGAASVVDAPLGVTLDIHGVGILFFGELLQWRLISEPPAQIKAGDGIKLGGVLLQSSDGKVSYRLMDTGGFSSAENGNGCKVERVGTYALIRCDTEYVFNTAKAGPPVKVWPQFNDRSDKGGVPDYVANLPLPWWKLAPGGIGGTAYVFLDYGSTNYGQNIDSSEVPLGPALLDLETGQIALARTGPQPNSPLYDASAGQANAPVAMPSKGDKVTAIARAGARTLVTVSTSFGSCPGGGAPPCGGAVEPRVTGRRLLYYSFDPHP